MTGVWRAAALVWLALVPVAPWAQEAGPGDPAAPQSQDLVFPSPVLVVDLERIYAETMFGQRIEAEKNDALQILDADNRALLEELEREERDIAERRETLTPEEFRAEADAFDIKVQDIRARQDERLTEIEASIAAERLAFDARIRPVLGQIMLDRRGVILFEAADAYAIVRSVDITDQSIAILNAFLGDGTGTADQ